MTILIVLHEHPDNVMAGAQLYGMQLARNLAMSNCRVVVLYPTKIKGNESKVMGFTWFDAGGLDLVSVGRVRRAFFEFPEDYRINKEIYHNFLKQIDPSLVLVNGVGHLGVEFMAALAQSKFKYRLLIHDFWYMCHRFHLVRQESHVKLCSGPDSFSKCAGCAKHWNASYWRDARLRLSEKRLETLIARFQQVCRFLLLQSDGNFAPSTFLVDVYRKYLGVKLEALPLGKVVESLGEVCFSKDGEFIVGVVCSINPLKNTERFFQLAETILQNYQCILVGSLTENFFRKYLHLRNLFPGKIDWIGEIKQKDMASFYGRIRVLFNFSMHETYSLVVSEAAIFGVRAIIEKIDIAEELVDRHGALVVDFDDKEQVMEAIQYAINIPISNAQKRLDSEFKMLVERLTA